MMVFGPRFFPRTGSTWGVRRHGTARAFSLGLMVAVLASSTSLFQVARAAPPFSAEEGNSDLQVYSVIPSQADSRVRNYDQPSYAILNPAAPKSTPLVVYMPGTAGTPSPTSVIGNFVAGLGYRALVLTYNDKPSISQVCPQDPDPNCSQRFREMRTTGEGGFVREQNSKAEAIVPRLRAALTWLARQYPDAGWDQYLVDGEPNWPRLVLSGLSQGAGMAAYLAHRHPVDRVVLFSSPWDTTGQDQHPAPWLFEPSQTPRDRWFAAYHERENTARLIANAYQALNIPRDHILIFQHDLPMQARRVNASNPFHAITTHDPRYAPQWRAMFGDPLEGH